MNELSTTTTLPPSFESARTEKADARWPESTLHVCLLGGRGSGKTCFLGGLGILDRLCGWHLRADNQSTNRLDDIVTTLTERNGWLAPTRDTDRYLITVSFDSQTVSFDTFDYPGVYVQTAIRNLNSHVEPDLLRHYLEADVLLVLLDPDEDPVDIPVLSALDDALKHRFMSAGTKRPAVGIVVTKADRYELRNSAQAEAFLRERCPAFLTKLKGLAGRVTVFPVSAVGTVDEHGRPAVHARPSGYEPLFRWLVSRERTRHRRPWGRRILLSSLLLLAGLAVWRVPDAMNYLNAKDTLRETTLPAVERLDRTRSYEGWFSPWLNTERSRVAQEELAQLQTAVQSVPDDAAARQVVEQARGAAIRSPEAVRPDLVAVSRTANDRAATFGLDQVRQLRDASDRNWMEQGRLLIDRFHDSTQAATVRGWLAGEFPQAQREAALPIARIEIDNQASCQYKADAIRRYLQEWGSKHPPSERRRIERAAELGELFARRREWAINLHSAGEFKKARRMVVRICYPDNDFVAVNSHDPAQRLSFTEEPMPLDWRPGMSLRVQIWGDESWFEGKRHDTLAASITLDGSLALLDLANGDGLWLTSDRRWREDFTGIPTVRFRARGIDAEDARIARDYLSPGLRWK